MKKTKEVLPIELIVIGNSIVGLVISWRILYDILPSVRNQINISIPILWILLLAMGLYVIKLNKKLKRKEDISIIQELWGIILIVMTGIFLILNIVIINSTIKIW